MVSDRRLHDAAMNAVSGELRILTRTWHVAIYRDQGRTDSGPFGSQRIADQIAVELAKAGGVTRVHVYDTLD